MKIEQITNTRIVAGEGKVFRHRATGAVYGEQISLGYNYYEAGVPLSEGHLQTPEEFEEIDRPEDYVSFTIAPALRLRTLERVQTQVRRDIQGYALSASDALEFMEYYPAWGEGFGEGDELPAGFRFRYSGKLYEVIAPVTLRPLYEPSEHTTGLYREVSADDDRTRGTAANPIAYNGGMPLERGCCYRQDDVTYLCIRSTEGAVTNPLSELTDLYVTVCQ